MRSREILEWLKQLHSHFIHVACGVAEAAQNTTRGALDTQKAAAELARMATSLRDLVARFKA